MSKQEELDQFVRSSFASFSGVPEDVLFVEDFTLGDVIHRSEKMINSIDLMEAFAKVANSARAKYGVSVRLAPQPLATPVVAVARTFSAELSKLMETSHGSR